MIQPKTGLIALAMCVASSFSLTACGGGEPEPKVPESMVEAPTATATPAAGEAKPEDSSKVPELPAPSVAATAPAPAPAFSLDLPASTAKIALKGKTAAKVELMSDGTLTSGGKTVGKFSGLTVQNKSGDKTLLSVSPDGAITSPDGSAYGSFAGDELTMAKGDKLSIDESGVLTMTAGGKTSTVGKVDGASGAKRSTVLAAAIVMAPPSEKATPKADKTAKPGPSPKMPAPKKK